MINLNSTFIPIKEFEGLYEISDTGHIRSVRRFVTDKNGVNIPKGGKYLSPGDNGAGYKFVQLWKDNIPHRKYVHSLVAEMFLPNPENKTKVNHKDGIKEHNYVNNLEWVTDSENMIHSYSNNLHKSGENHSNSKLSNLERIKIIEEYANNNLGQVNTAKLFGVTSNVLFRLITKFIKNNPNDDIAKKLLLKRSNNLKR